MPAFAQQDDLQFQEELITACLAEKNASTSRECIGLAANVCQEATLSGSTTVGMGFCLGMELDFWDAMLNDTYANLAIRDKGDDEEAERMGWTAPAKFPALREAQRKWIEYRDAKCDYERSQWGGGTGGGPAAIACLMGETATRALELQAILDDWG